MVAAILSSSTALQRGQQTAVQQGSRRLSFAQLDARSTALAEALLSLGLAAGDGVAVQMPMCIELAEIECALHKAGLAKVGVGVLASPEEVGRKLACSGARVFITHDGSCGYSAATPGFASVATFICTGKPAKGFVAYGELAGPADLTQTLEDAAAGEGSRMALVGPFTSASSVMLTQAHLHAGSTLVLFDDFASASFLHDPSGRDITYVLLDADKLRQMMNASADLPAASLRPRPADAGGDDEDCAAAEAALCAHPAVMEACVVRIPGKADDDKLKAMVALHPGRQAGAAELIAHCRAHCVPHQCPVSVDFVAELPKNASGKPARKLIREQYRQAYRLPR